MKIFLTRVRIIRLGTPSVEAANAQVLLKSFRVRAK